MTRCRIADAGGAIRDGLDLEGREDRALVRLNYQGGDLTMRTFPKAFAMATKMYRDHPDTFAQAWGTEAEFRMPNQQFLEPESEAPPPTSVSHPPVAPFSGTAHRTFDLDGMD